MLWRGVSAAGPKRLVKVESKTNAKKLQEILKDSFIQSARELPIKRTCVIQLDNDQKHSNKASQKQFKDNVNVLESPS